MSMSSSPSVTGRVHSVETFGALDGPGIRYVVFYRGALFAAFIVTTPTPCALPTGPKRQRKRW